MIALILGWLRKFGGWLVAGIAVVALIFSVRHGARMSGRVEVEKYLGESKKAIIEDIADKAIVEAKVQRDVVERNLEVVKNVEDEIIAIDDAAVFDILRKYQRD